MVSDFQSEACLFILYMVVVVAVVLVENVFQAVELFQVSLAPKDADPDQILVNIVSKITSGGYEDEASTRQSFAKSDTIEKVGFDAQVTSQATVFKADGTPRK